MAHSALAYRSAGSGNPIEGTISRPYAFTARPWELTKTESIDVMDAVGSNIRIDTRGREVLRILPRMNEAVNEEWIADKSRFVWDGLRTQRLDRPYVRENGKLRAASWNEAFEAISQRLKRAKPERMAAIVGDLAPTEAVKALKDLMSALECRNLDCRQDGAALGGPRESYLFNTTIAALEEADAILLIGTNPRVEAPLVNARIRRAWLRNLNLKIGLIGEDATLTYGYERLGAGPDALARLAEGGPAFFEALKKAAKPAIIVGMGALARPDGAAVLSEAARLAAAVGAVKDGWNGFNVLHTAAARVGALDLKFLPGANGLDFKEILEACGRREIEVVYNLGADEIEPEKFRGAFVVYQGHHGDAGARYADVILPGAAYAEQSGIFVNMEGRPQLANRAMFPPGDAREDWAIIRALSDRVGKTLPYDDLFALRQAMIAEVPTLGRIGATPALSKPDVASFGKKGPLSPEPFRPVIRDYYLTNAIARASKTMAECSAVASGAAKMAAE